MQPLELENLIETGLAALELHDTYLVNVRVKNNKIEVFLDSDTGIDFIKCQKLSRWLEAVLDEKKTFGENYILEVSSSGVGSPLLLLRQYPKNIGRLIEIKYSDNKQVKGYLKDVQGDVISVEYETKTKEGKKNIKSIITEQIKFEDIIESKIKISFN
ncbi:MAG TPA: ribosome maturation factor [Saprospiraceae bacterium]|nr:ribosome maturation factor [Saprospiraceae bacterium]HRO07550.1 ribosome maturation factor [Saprospiraceae bacterium]HRP40833.1 ribosome maturation factor [Saprospiraceae bacterium]